MSIYLARVGLCVFCCSLIVGTGCLAQKADEWAIQNAMIGPSSPIEVQAGSSYQAQAMYPVPDGPLFPLKAGVEWSIAPAVKGISIDAKTGKISVAEDVAHGSTATVQANVAGGRRKLKTKLYVFKRDQNPLVGKWYVDSHTACGDAQEIKVPVFRPRSLYGATWKFHVDQQFWAGKEMNIAAGTWLSGRYEHDAKTAKIKLTTEWPKDRPVSNWSYLLKDGGKTLLLHPLEPQDDLEPGCSYVLNLL